MRIISFDQFFLSNGLKVLVHEDFSNPNVVVYVLYDVGSRDEDPDKTGLAHLCEHLLFIGTKNIPNFYKLLHHAAGDTNGGTSPDHTEYFIELPAENAEVAFWMESERMSKPLFNRKNVETEKKIIQQEYKEMFADDPYSEGVLNLHSLSYKKHPYQWLPFGDMDHVKKLSLDDVQNFFSKFYCPNNAIMVVAGNISVSKAQYFAEKWFSDIPAGNKHVRNLPVEPEQKEPRRVVLEADVPLNTIYKCFPMPGLMKPGYCDATMLASILGDGASSRLYKVLVKEKKLFSDIDCEVDDSIDPGLFTIEGSVEKNIDIMVAERALEDELHKTLSTSISERELLKVKNNVESDILFEEMDLTERASKIAICELLGNAHIINTSLDEYFSVTSERIIDTGRKLFRRECSNTLVLRSKNIS